jgi:predicted dehydrogenase
MNETGISAFRLEGTVAIPPSLSRNASTALPASPLVSTRSSVGDARSTGVPWGTAHSDHPHRTATTATVVSVCAWMHLHEPMVVDSCAAGVKAIYSEKPMANTWGGARRMAAAAKAAGVQLTFNHQRRYGVAWATGKKLLDDGAIGDLVRLESECPNIYEFGTHSIDMLSFYNNETPAKWVIGQIDYRKESLVFGGHTENQNLVLTEYDNGVFGFLANGAGGARPVGCFTRLIGTDGTIEVYPAGGPALRYRPAGSKEWIVPELGPDVDQISVAIADAMACLKEGRKCQLDVSNALIATEIIFGAYESSRRRGRVDFPLEIDDNPLEAMVASGDLKPAKG